jgi:hypothetical protein
MCIDSRALNKISIKSNHLLPGMDDLLDMLANSSSSQKSILGLATTILNERRKM